MKTVEATDLSLAPDITAQRSLGTAGMTRLSGELAASCCRAELALQVLESGAGFYLGTADASGPVSRESQEYFGTRAAAARALEDGRWTQRHEP